MSVRTENEWKREFDELRAAHGAMAAKATWQDYLDAYGHTRCSVREYFLFKFYEKDRETRDSYLTLQRRDRFIHQIHDDESCNATVPGNKVLFNMLFEPYLCREWINPTVGYAGGICRLCQKARQGDAQARLRWQGPWHQHLRIHHRRGRRSPCTIRSWAPP